MDMNNIYEYCFRGLFKLFFLGLVLGYMDYS